MTDTTDYAALGFTLTPSEAAYAADLTPAEVLDAIRSGDVTCLLLAEGERGPGGAFLLRPESLNDLRRRQAEKWRTVDEGNRAKVQRVLRAYLAARPAAADYDAALADNLPVLGRLRSGADAVHVRIPAVLAFARSLPRAPLLTSSAIETALEDIGAVRVRGLTPTGDPGGKQRWHIWFRVPASLMPGSGEDGVALDVTAGVVEPGERVTVRGNGRPYLREPIGSSPDSID